ncbi:hypothetical protein BDZ89DRAFT_1059037 [Hymenopellis radicata]|nr:hypothetical protein BDZ89DRAFT_1059037 [Hymenopellis radicata]
MFTPPNTRRIVTSHNGDGKACIQIDSKLQWNDIPSLGAKVARIYIIEDGLPTKDNNSSIDGAERDLDPNNLNLLPKSPGANTGATLLCPGGVTPLHRSSSQDYNILVEGELILLMEDGTEKHIKTPGDVVVMKGGLHAWKNPSTTNWAHWVSVLVSAEPVKVDGQPLSVMSV